MARIWCGGVFLLLLSAPAFAQIPGLSQTQPEAKEGYPNAHGPLELLTRWFEVKRHRLELQQGIQLDETSLEGLNEEIKTQDDTIQVTQSIIPTLRGAAKKAKQVELKVAKAKL